LTFRRLKVVHLVSKLHGVCAILATPFDSQKRLDDRGLRALVDFELNWSSWNNDTWNPRRSA
jgi:hypothetical protein